MTTEEKLKICIDFIKKIESLDMTMIDYDDSGMAIVDPCDITSFKDQAWHTLAQITD